MANRKAYLGWVNKGAFPSVNTVKLPICGAYYPTSRGRNSGWGTQCGKGVEDKERSNSSVLATDRRAVLTRAPSPTATGASIAYWNWPWLDAPERVSYFMALGGEEVLGLQWDCRPHAAGTHGDVLLPGLAHTFGRRAKVGAPVWHNPSP